MDLSGLRPIGRLFYHQTSWLDSLGAVACCERIRAPVPAILLGLTKYPYSSNRPSPAATAHVQLLASNSGANRPETEMVAPQALHPRVPETEMVVPQALHPRVPETEMVAPQALHPRVPETEMMAPLVPNQQETEKRALWPTCSRMALESRPNPRPNQLPWCQTNQNRKWWHHYPPPDRNKE